MSDFAKRWTVKDNESQILGDEYAPVAQSFNPSTDAKNAFVAALKAVDRAVETGTVDFQLNINGDVNKAFLWVTTSSPMGKKMTYCSRIRQYEITLEAAANATTAALFHDWQTSGPPKGPTLILDDIDFDALDTQPTPPSAEKQKQIEDKTLTSSSGLKFGEEARKMLAEVADVNFDKRHTPLEFDALPNGEAVSLTGQALVNVCSLLSAARGCAQAQMVSKQKFTDEQRSAMRRETLKHLNETLKHIHLSAPEIETPPAPPPHNGDF